ncbi:MAG: zinc-dependent alcohol dehydrogenase [Armatimonadota bacterium]
MKAAVFTGRREVAIQDVPMPNCPDDGVIVQVMASGICGSDKWLFLNDGPKPGIHGHEAAGVVVEVGPKVTRRAVGDRVAVYDVIGCGVCSYCSVGEFTRCRNRKGSVSGGYGQYVACPERNALPLPDDVSFERGCLMLDAMGTPAKAARRLGVSRGMTVAIYGCGPIGLNAVQVCTGMGARAIAVDPVGYRRDAAVRLGAVMAIDPQDGPPSLAILDATGEGADRAMECSGNPNALHQAIESVHPDGWVGVVGECGRAEISPSDDLIRRDAHVMGSWYLNLEDFYRNIELYRFTSADPLRVVTHIVPLAEIERGFRVFCDHEDGCLKVVVRMQE